MIDYLKDLHYEDYNETQYFMDYKGFTFYWPKIMPFHWLGDWLLRESFEPNHDHDYLSLYTPDPNDVLYDMGSSEGIFTKKVAQIGVKKIYAFDPLQCFIESINLLFANDSSFESFCIGFADHTYTDTYANFPIEIVTIDLFMEMHPNILPPTIIKMDLEGYDLAALHGGINTIKKYKPNLLLCKYHKGEDRQDFINFLTPLKYKLQSETGNGLMYLSVK